MMAAHKWAHVIKAWADGKSIQSRCYGVKEWDTYDTTRNNTPPFGLTDTEWRVPVLHQEAWDHYAAGGHVKCIGPFGGNPPLWTNHESTRLQRLCDTRWDDKSFTFTIVPKDVVVMAYCRRFDGGSLDVNLMPQLQHNLKLTFSAEGKLLTAEVIG